MKIAESIIGGILVGVFGESSTRILREFLGKYRYSRKNPGGIFSKIPDEWIFGGVQIVILAGISEAIFGEFFKVIFRGIP